MLSLGAVFAALNLDSEIIADIQPTAMKYWLSSKSETGSAESEAAEGKDEIKEKFTKE